MTAETPLVTLTNIASPPPVLGLVLQPVQDAVFEQRARRWELQRVSAKLLFGHRVGVCMHTVRAEVQGVSVHRRLDKSTYYGGLMVCGSIWACPVCAGKITERRRKELREGIAAWRGADQHVSMLTLTVPHTRENRAFELVNTLSRIVRAFWSGKNSPSRTIPGYVGQVRSSEITHGSNGWHPHLHILLFTSERIPPRIEAALRRRWAALVKRHGLGDVNQHGMRLDDGSRAADYVAKFGREKRWDMAEELTKSQVKRGRSKASRTPWAILEDAADGCERSGDLWREYVAAMHRKKQLQWSPGLRAGLGLVEDLTDIEVATEDADTRDDEVALFMSRSEWKIVLRAGMRYTLLHLARELPEAALYDYLERWGRLNA